MSLMWTFNIWRLLPRIIVEVGRGSFFFFHLLFMCFAPFIFDISSKPFGIWAKKEAGMTETRHKAAFLLPLWRAFVIPAISVGADCPL